MAKKKHAEEHENLERWLVSYADFMTLLFATFVVLYALSQIDLAKFKLLKESIKKAFSAPTIIDSPSTGGKKSDDPSILNSDGKSILNEAGTPDDAPITPIMVALEQKSEADNFNNIKGELDKLDKESGIKAQITDRGLVINLDNSIFFESGRSQLNQASYIKLNKIATMLKTRLSDHSIKVEGHTDSLSIQSDIYPSNWELSSARAAGVIRYFINNFKFNKNSFTAVGYGDSRPLGSNLTEAGRSKNRRVEIVVLRNKFLNAESKIKGINRLRIEKIKEYQVKNNIKIEKVKALVDAPEGTSDAAKKLINDNHSKIVIYKDAYDMQSDTLSKNLKNLEDKFLKSKKK